MYSQLNTYNMLVGQPLGMNARMFDRSSLPAGWRAGRHSAPPAALRGAVQYAEMNVVYPDGVQRDYTMSDDGLSGDGVCL